MRKHLHRVKAYNIPSNMFKIFNPRIHRLVPFPYEYLCYISVFNALFLLIQVMPQMSVPHNLTKYPPPMLAIPPPSIQNVDQITTVTTPLVQQSNIISQNTTTMVTATPVQSIAGQPQIIQQQILPNMVIQQTNLPTNLNVPPPTNIIPMKQGHIVPSQVQLSQPPPNIQLQQQPTQIVLNQPQANYQYIQQAPTDGSQQQSVTIQHIYQPQGIVQQTQQLNSFTTQQAAIRPSSQQYIVQGNTA